MGQMLREVPIPLSAAIAPVDPVSVQPRARGSVDVSAKATARGAGLCGLRQSGSLKCLFPHGRGETLEAVLVNTAGGITGGDRFEVTARAGADTVLTLTTQAAERAYRAAPGETGRLDTRIRVEAGARVNWLPQETILFDGCAFERSLKIDLAADAGLLMVEPLVFGRAAMGERLGQARFHDRIEIAREGAPVFVDALRLTGDVAAHLARPHIADGAGAMALIVYAASDTEAHLEALRGLAGPTGGASLVRDDLLVARVLAGDSFALRRHIVPALTRLSRNTLPRCWMI